MEKRRKRKGATRLTGAHFEPAYVLYGIKSSVVRRFDSVQDKDPLPETIASMNIKEKTDFLSSFPHSSL